MNLSCLSRSTSSCQSWAIARIPNAPFFCPALGYSPALTKVIVQVVLRTWLQVLIPLLMASAIDFSTWFWCQMYRPCLHTWCLVMVVWTTLWGMDPHALARSNHSTERSPLFSYFPNELRHHFSVFQTPRHSGRSN